MTRLEGKDIKDIGTTLEQYDESIKKKTGCSLKEIAIHSAGIAERVFEKALGIYPVGVIPITCGQGLIEGFVESVGAILEHVGARIIRPEGKDVTGMAEVIEKGARVIFCSDDDRFVAINLPLARVVDNIEATAKGYVTALERMTKGVLGRRVLVIGGAGRLGWRAVNLLEMKGARVGVFDIDQIKVRELTTGRKTVVESDLEKALEQYPILFDASPASNIIRSEHIRPETLIAAPGIPLGCTAEALALVKDRLIHDPLQIGVATMLAEVVRNGQISSC